MSREYIQKQVAIFTGFYSEKLKENALWRIASHADLIPPGVQELSGAARTETIDWLYENGYLIDSEG